MCRQTRCAAHIIQAGDGNATPQLLLWDGPQHTVPPIEGEYLHVCLYTFRREERSHQASVGIRNISNMTQNRGSNSITSLEWNIERHYCKTLNPITVTDQQTLMLH